jgi:hypothetical protein
MSDKKQTAVSWIEQQLKDILEKNNIIMEDSIWNHAQQMKREQIIDAFSEGTKMININDELSARFNACVYYVENYESQDEN